MTMICVKKYCKYGAEYYQDHDNQHEQDIE